MKSILFCLLAFLGTSVLAQNSFQQYALPLNKEIISKNDVVQDLDMGMGMLMKTNISTTTQYKVIGLAGDEYMVTRTITALKLNMDMMGQTQNYDSDLQTDKNSEMGKEMNKRLNVPDTFTYNRKTGLAVMLSKPVEEKDDSNPVAGMLSSFGGNAQPLVIEDIFFPLGESVKVGGAWVDSSSSKEISYVKNYTLTSKGNNNEISFNSDTKNNMETETQGMMITINMDTKANGTMAVDPLTSIVMNKKSNSTIEGSFEVMGQNSAISGTTTSTITTQIK